MGDIMIRCEELVKIYSDSQLKVMALQGLDLEVERGELMAVIGKSGSGKSTLLNLIGGLETLTAGRLFVNGRDLSAMRERDLMHYRRAGVGFVWQDSAKNLLPYLTAQQNVEYPLLLEGVPARERSARARLLLEEVEMASHANKLPSELSGGEQQRVAIAVALAADPPLLLADEPTGSVDSVTAHRIFGLFQKMCRQKNLTILVVTHDMGLSDKVGRTVMISDGKISTEKIMREGGEVGFGGREILEEYVVMDRAHRLQLSEEILKEAGIVSDRVRLEVIDGKVVIQSKNV